MDATVNLIIKKIAELTRRGEADVRHDRALRELVHDSFALVELVVGLQDEFNVQLSHKDFAHVVTVQDLTTLIGSRLSATAT